MAMNPEMRAITLEAKEQTALVAGLEDAITQDILLRKINPTDWGQAEGLRRSLISDERPPALQPETAEDLALTISELAGNVWLHCSDTSDAETADNPLLTARIGLMGKHLVLMTLRYSGPGQEMALQSFREFQQLSPKEQLDQLLRGTVTEAERRDTDEEIEMAGLAGRLVDDQAGEEDLREHGDHGRGLGVVTHMGVRRGVARTIDPETGKPNGVCYWYQLDNHTEPSSGQASRDRQAA